MLSPVKRVPAREELVARLSSRTTLSHVLGRPEAVPASRWLGKAGEQAQGWVGVFRPVHPPVCLQSKRGARG